MVKSTIISNLAEELWLSKKLTAELFNAMLKKIEVGVKKQWEVKIQWFGVFKKCKRGTIIAVNPYNPKEKIKIPAMNIVIFKAGSEFKGLIN